jgi:hypothetical protein
VSEPSATRRELEASLRSFLPKEVQIGGSLTDSKPTVAAVGVGGVLTGYVWGRLRGRRLRKSKAKVTSESKKSKSEAKKSKSAAKRSKSESKKDS